MLTRERFRQRIRRWLAPLVLVLTPACAPDPRVAPSPDFTDAQRNAIGLAVTQWNTILRNPMYVSTDGPWHIIKQTPPGKAAHGYIGETNRDYNLVYIDPGLDADQVKFYRVVLHELGHVAGLHHVQGQSVMSPSVNTSVFSKEDYEECVRVGACGLMGIDLAKCQMQGVCY